LTHNRIFAWSSLALLAAGTLAAGPEEPREPWNITAQTSRVNRSAEGGRILAFENDVVITHGDRSPPRTAPSTSRVCGAR
jgi:hypothetical protein